MILIYIIWKISVYIAGLPFKNTVERDTGNQMLQITSMGEIIHRDVIFNCTHSLKGGMKSASPEPEAPRQPKELPHVKKYHNISLQP